MGRYRSRDYKNAQGVKVRQCTRCGKSKPLTSDNWGSTKNDSTGFRRQCKTCITEFNRERGRRNKARRKQQQGGEKVPEQKQDGSKTTVVVCSCGHAWSYEIDRPSMVEWLKKKPCPPCAAKNKNETPEQKKKREAQEKKQEQERAKAEKEAQKQEAERAKKLEEERQARIDKSWVSRILAMLPEGELFHNVLVEVLMALDAGLVIWLQGPPGTSKSTLAEQAARGLGKNFYPMSCHEYMTESKLFGFVDANGTEHRTPFWDAFEYGGVLLLDEVDNGNPNLLAALNSALSNGHCVFAGRRIVQRHEDFLVIATANTAGLGPEHGFIGRNGVDLATRDRFITLDVPIDTELESALAAMHMGEDIEDLGLSEMFVQHAKDKLERRSINREDDLTSKQVVEAVQKMRAAVDGRFRGQVVSPRASIHVAAMVKAGFTLKEALKAKLPGVKPSEMDTVVNDAVVY